ncbi:Cytochrome c oxidase assembly protein COX19 [Sphaceloma murrayae]|uniref:Cytochrome c oxidase assembly protein COX19 n=1 Tax=Sphaceloma murrayae TaxID=2082308 RepID=A0A2K1R018_9PEZI|nr:Cytochrome c oxidase assembly protein COX19 [Sphaceloma murrayae]
MPRSSLNFLERPSSLRHVMESSSGKVGESSKSQEWEQGASQYKAKRNSEYFDPCQEAADRSLKCLRRNGGSRDMCMDYFDAYRECKKKWQLELAEEKRKAGRWF